MKTLRDRLVFCVAAMLLFGVSSTGVAQSTAIGSGASDLPETVEVPEPEYGTSAMSIHNVSITEFRKIDSTYSLTADVVTAVHFHQNAPAAQGDWWAPVKLPAGAVVYYVEMDACDTSATGQIAFGMARSPVAASSGGGNVTPVGGTGVAATPGCGLTSVSASQLLINNLSNHYWIFVAWSGDFTSANKVAGFRVFYRLQVSPSPAVATFPNDVPTGHPFFRFVEALAAAGITGGCGAGSYCPDQPVTRGQIAVFLSAALGLHWPN